MASPKPVTVQTLSPQNWRLFRALRLDALKEAPYAFRSKLADWQGAHDTASRWRARLTGVPLNVVAYLDGIPAGMAGGTIQNAAEVKLISMWVAPSARGERVGETLVSTVARWARRSDAACVSLDVREDNRHARRFYERCGFVDRGRIEGIVTAPERRMTLSKLPACDPENVRATVRPLVDSDLDRIKTIDKAAFRSEDQYDDGMYQRMLQSGRSVVILDKSTIVGYAFVQTHLDTHVRSLAVDPVRRREGFGKAMLQTVIADAHREVDLLVDEANEPAIRLYGSLGFEPAEMCPTIPPKRRMVLRLASRTG